ncbi:MAG: hypothetical protein JOY79_05550 [Acidobacteriaceae bacterium]|nr:hypothetical protein [Acidobacteriaceae bacterium]
MINRVSVWLAVMISFAIWAILVSPAVPSVPSLLPITQLLACFVVGVALLSIAEPLAQCTASASGAPPSRPSLTCCVARRLIVPLRR